MKTLGLLITASLLLAEVPVQAQKDPEESHPKIGLVLGGGGALGISHIGILKVLEEEHIPVDYIVGTSMGSIIAGLYASGMSPDEIQAFLQGLDWHEVMTDATPRRELYFRRKFEDQRYLFDLGIGRNGLKMGTGLAAGQKFNNLLQYEVQRTASITNYNDLPIPFRACATDLISGKAYVMDHGNLARSMRASMAVPAIFTAVELDGRILVDGGIVNNLPVDVMEEMGADIIIAVDVGSAGDIVDLEKLKSIGGVLGRTYAIAQRPEQIESLKRADIGLQPNLVGFTASQFDRVAEFVPKGADAARAKISELRKLSIDPEAFQARIKKQRRAMPGSIELSGVEITGAERVSEKAIQGRIYSKPGEPFDVNTLQLDLMRVYGIGEFEQILFKLEQQDDATGTLTYEATESPAGPLYLAVGLNLRSDFDYDSDWNILLNVTRRSVNALGAEWRNELILGSVQGLLSEFYQPLNYGGTFFVAPVLNYRSETENVYDGKDRIAEYDVEKTVGRLDFGIQLRHFAELRVGPMWGTGNADIAVGPPALPEFDETYFGATAQLIIDRQDRTYFAREGGLLNIQGDFPRKEAGGDVSFDKIGALGRIHKSIGDHTGTLGFEYGDSLGTDLPAYAQFTLGGAESFSGLAEDQFRGSALGVVSASYRYRLMRLPSQLGQGVYLISRFDTGNVWADDTDLDDLRYGFSAGIGADTSAGPIYLTYGWADGGYSRIYFALGSVF